MLTVLLLLAAAWTSSLVSASQPIDAVSEPLKVSKSPLEEPMEDLKAGVKMLRRQLSNPEHSAVAIETLSKMQLAAIECCRHNPTPISEMDETQTKLWNIEFHRGMLEVADILCQLEAAVISGEETEIQALFRKLGASKKSGHKKFQPEEE